MSKIEYNPRDYVKIDDAVKLAGRDLENLEENVARSGSKIYSENGFRYMNRIDLGRVVYNASNGLQAKEKEGIGFERYFTDGKTNPFDTVGPYEDRSVSIKDTEGNTIFQMNAYAPKSWSDVSVKVAANKYFFKPKDQGWVSKIEGGFERSPKQLFARVSRFFSNWGDKLGYFKTEEERKAFEDELNYLQINQMVAFNSPVYFNAGLFDMYGIPGTKGIRYARNPETAEVERIEDGCYIRPQTHACFIKGPKDDLESILDHVKVEGTVFSDGSGIGQGLDPLRSRGELISSGGRASGPMSFLRAYDLWGGIIESGGKTRRAARMTTMRQHHPDIMEFITKKREEDHKALILMKNGYSTGFEGDAYKTVAFQNTNLSVRLDEHFFEQLNKGGNIELREVKSGKIVKEVPADYMLKQIAFGSWRIGDPGVQYESKIQEMNTVKNSGMIDSSNPCSEYMFLNDTSCNLVSLNLLKFADKEGNLNIQDLEKAFRTVMIAADVTNDAASYPHPDIAKLSPEFRTTGIGYANLGALLMRKGLPYDSNEGRAYAGAITALMQAETLRTSAELAKGLGPFVHYEINKEPMIDVVKKHRAAIEQIGNWHPVYGENLDKKSVKGLEDLIDESRKRMDDAIELGSKHGFRNAQTTVIAPTGTIAFLMGCDTTGIEPAIALSITKNLSGGGTLDLVVDEVPNALRNLGYKENQINDIAEHIKKNKTVEDAPWLEEKHYAVFDTAFSQMSRGRTVDFRGHIKMLAAAQPFISGAISKTSNLPGWATVKDIYDGYILGHELGLKALATFRDRGKPTSALDFGDNNTVRELKRGEKRELPNPRESFKTEVKINGVPLHVSVGEYEDGTPGEIFFDSHRLGSTVGGLLGMLAITASRGLKGGEQLERLIDGWRGHKIEELSGLVVNDPYIKTALSPLDYAAKFLQLHYLGNKDVAQEPDKVDVKTLRGYKNGAFKTYEMAKIDQWNFDQVVNHPELGGFRSRNGDDRDTQKAKADEKSNGDTKLKNERGVSCKECGFLMLQTATNCYMCTNCDNKLGGC